MHTSRTNHAELLGNAYILIDYAFVISFCPVAVLWGHSPQVGSSAQPRSGAGLLIALDGTDGASGPRC